MKFINFFIFLFIFGLSACKNTEVPQWYSNPTINNNSFYGIGFSTVSYEDAKRRALIDITSQIKTNVSAVSQSNITKVNDRATKTFVQTATAQIDNLEINNYNIDKQIANDNGFYILISLNKSDFIVFLENDISSKINMLKETILDLQNKNAGQKLLKFKYMKSILKSIYEKDFILRVLDKNYNLKYQKDILELEKKVTLMKNNVSFAIDCENQKIRDIFTRILNKNEFKIISSTANANLDIVKIKIDYSEQELKVFDSFVFKVNLNCHLMSDNNDFFSFVVDKSGMSPAGQTQAKANLYKTLEEYLNENLINNIIESI